MRNTKDLAQGRWYEILTKLGVDELFLDGNHRACPNCGGKDRFRFDDLQGAGTYFCNQCGPGDGFSLVQKICGLNSFKVTAGLIDDVIGLKVGVMVNSMPKKVVTKSRETSPEVQKKCLQIWRASGAVDNSHNYLTKKGVKAFGIRQIKGKLVIPISKEGKLISLQIINKTGVKTFKKGAKVSGGYFIIKARKKRTSIVVCEGYATAATIHQLLGCDVIVAFTAANLSRVTARFRNKYPEHKIIIACDNDRKNTKNIGYESALKAALAIDGVIALVPNKPGENTDWNDYYLENKKELFVDSFLAAVREGERNIKKTVGSEYSSNHDDVSLCEMPEALPKDLAPIAEFDAPRMLPQVFSDYVLDISIRLQCPPEFVACMLIGSLSGVVGKSCTILPKEFDNWKVAPNLWSAIVGRPSSMKSPAMSAALVGVSSLSKKATEDYKQRLGDYELDKMIYDAKAMKLKK